MRLPDFARTSIFRRTAIASAVCIALFAAFVYSQTVSFVISQIDNAIAEEAATLLDDAPARRREAIEDRLRQDPRRIRLGALFAADGARIAGNVATLPRDLPLGGPVRSAMLERLDPRGDERQTVRAIARALPGGEVLVIGRNIDERSRLAELVWRAILLGLPLSLLAGLVTSYIMSAHGEAKLQGLNALVQKIVAGDLKQRLPTEGLDHPFDKIASITNGMLDEIETLLHRMANVGNEIAHDLRTPLTRVRVALERGRANAGSVEELRAVVDRAIGGLDQSLAIITALLRIAEIEQSRRLAGFGEVALDDIVREVGDLYEPIAEDKGVRFEAQPGERLTVRGDRDLLLEAVANLVDNALKFTPQGGAVRLALRGDANAPVLRIEDSGPGIAEEERESVMRRFYRSDKSRHTPGVGLGLSLVAAVVKLHDFRLTIGAGPGCVAEIACARGTVAA